jgi:lysophospholipase L1-like esterase
MSTTDLKSIIGAGLLAASLGCSVALAAPPPAGATYVALGSSYAAGTSLRRPADDSPAGCGQGTDSYPRQVARALNLRLVDRSCGGATTVHVLKGGQFDLPAQLAALTPETRLVSLTIGGNDVRFTADLGLFSCLTQSQGAAPAACGARPADFVLEPAFTQLEANFRQIMVEIRRRAPAARIVVVDYVAVLPPGGSCAPLGLTSEQASDLRARATRLAAVTAKVAAEAGADLIPASRITADHNVCAADPWAWGAVSPEERARSEAVGFHPRVEAMTAVARAIVERLKQ